MALARNLLCETHSYFDTIGRSTMCTMKCPRCGQLATKPKPQGDFACGHCGWSLNAGVSYAPGYTKSSARQITPAR